jgi:hypothetical protein
MGLPDELQLKNYRRRTGAAVMLKAETVKQI